LLLFGYAVVVVHEMLLCVQFLGASCPLRFPKSTSGTLQGAVNDALFEAPSDSEAPNAFLYA